MSTYAEIIFYIMFNNGIAVWINYVLHYSLNNYIPETCVTLRIALQLFAINNKNTLSISNKCLPMSKQISAYLVRMNLVRSNNATNYI